MKILSYLSSKTEDKYQLTVTFEDFISDIVFTCDISDYPSQVEATKYLLTLANEYISPS